MYLVTRSMFLDVVWWRWRSFNWKAFLEDSLRIWPLDANRDPFMLICMESILCLSMRFIDMSRNCLLQNKEASKFVCWFSVNPIIHSASTHLGHNLSYIRCYSREVMIAFMHLCQKYQIHLLSDEIYALTTYPTNDIPHSVPFTSLLSIDKTGIINLSLCHVIHGMSKVPSPLNFVLILRLLFKWTTRFNVNISRKSTFPKSYPNSWVRISLDQTYD